MDAPDLYAAFAGEPNLVLLVAAIGAAVAVLALDVWDRVTAGEATPEPEDW